METLLVEIKNKKAYQLLKDLEDLNIIKVLKKKLISKPKERQKKLSEKYAGKLPSGVAEEIQEYVKQSRKEWSTPNT